MAIPMLDFSRLGELNPRILSSNVFFVPEMKKAMAFETAKATPIFL